MSGSNNRELRKRTSFVIGIFGKSQITPRMVFDIHQITGVLTSQVSLVLPSSSLDELQFHWWLTINSRPCLDL